MGIGTNSAVVCACYDVLLVLMVDSSTFPMQIMVKLYIGVNSVHMLHVVSLLKFDGETTM